MLKDLKWIPPHDLYKEVCTALQRANIPQIGKLIKMILALASPHTIFWCYLYASPFKYSVVQITTQSWICKDSPCPGHPSPTHKATGLTTKGPLMHSSSWASRTYADDRISRAHSHGQRKQRFQASWHVVIITPHKETTKAHEGRKLAISLQNRFSLCVI